MLDNIKNLILFKSVDKNILERNYDLALEKLNLLIKEDFKLTETYLKRGNLLKKLLMHEEAYSDFTYIINHLANKHEAYRERLNLNLEIANYKEAISDAEVLLLQEDKFEYKNVKFLALVFCGLTANAKDFILEVFENNKYKTLFYIFNETAKTLSLDDYSKGLKLLDIVDMIDRDNPIKLLKEANIYGLAGDITRQNALIKKIENVFPKYFVSHFKFTDMYHEKDLTEISFLLELSFFDQKGLFVYPLKILEGYKNYLEGHIIDSKECFEKAIEINPHKPEAYVLLAQTLQLMSGYDNPEYKKEAEINYNIAYKIYVNEGFNAKADDMLKQIKHLNSGLSFR